jgi:hypothetical protein
MIKYFTPEESKDIPHNQTVKNSIEQTGCQPSKLTMNFVMGYAAALKVVKTNSIGNMNILLN